MDQQGLFIGIDIGDKYSQISVYDEEKRNIIAVSDLNGLPLFANSTPIDEVYENRNATALATMLNAFINATKKKTEIPEVKMICVVIHEYTQVIRQLYSDAFKLLGIKRNNYMLVGDDEAFAYYAFSQSPDLSSVGTRLYNYSNKGLIVTTLKQVCFRGINIINETQDILDDKDVCAVAEGNLDISVVSRKITSFINDIDMKQRCSSAYLTGPGFDLGRQPEGIVNALNRSKTRIFAGQNLFVKGACLMAAAEFIPTIDPFKRIRKHGDPSVGKAAGRSNSILACKNRVTTDIKIKAVKFGTTEEISLVDIGANIDTQEKSFECIITDKLAIQLAITPLGGRTRREVIELTDFPTRERKCTRVQVSLNFPSEDTCVVTVVDLGFGNFYKGSGKIVVQEIPLQGQQDDKKTNNIGGVIVCSGKRSSKGFVCHETGVSIYSLEELVYYIYTNIFLVQKSFFSSQLVEFISEGTKRKDIAEKLLQLLNKGSKVTYLVFSLLRLVDYYSEKDILAIEPVLDSMETTNPIVRMYSIALSFKKNGVYERAIPTLKRVLEKKRDEDLTDGFYAKVNLCLGECYAHLFMYDKAAVHLEEAYKLDRDEKTLELSFYARILSGTESEILKEYESAPDIVSVMDASLSDNSGNLSEEEEDKQRFKKLFDKVKNNIHEYEKLTKISISSSSDEAFGRLGEKIEEWKERYSHSAKI